MRGLCGNMDGSMANDWTSRSGIEEKHLSVFAMSYGVCVSSQTTAALPHDLGLVVDTCSAADSAVILPPPPSPSPPHRPLVPLRLSTFDSPSSAFYLFKKQKAGMAHSDCG